MWGLSTHFCSKGWVATSHSIHQSLFFLPRTKGCERCHHIVGITKCSTGSWRASRMPGMSDRTLPERSRCLMSLCCTVRSQKVTVSNGEDVWVWVPFVLSLPWSARGKPQARCPAVPPFISSLNRLLLRHGCVQADQMQRTRKFAQASEALT